MRASDPLLNAHVADPAIDDALRWTPRVPRLVWNIDLQRWLPVAAVLLLFVTALVVSPPISLPNPFANTQGSVGDTTDFDGAALASASLFEPNGGRFDSAYDYVLRSDGGATSVMVGPGQMALALAGESSISVATMSFVDADPDVAPIPTGGGATLNFMVGDDPTAWQTGLTAAGAVEYTDVIGNADLRYIAVEDGFRFDVQVEAGGDPGDVLIDVDGAAMSMLDSGDLELQLPGGLSTLYSAPVAFQEVGGERRDVAAEFDLVDGDTIGFAIGSYDTSLPLIIDPTLDFTTTIGGSNSDVINDVAVDSFGTITVTGSTNSTDFPTTAGTYDQTSNGLNDVFVSHYAADGSTLLWSTYVGGSQDDEGIGLALASDGDVVVTGSAASTNFPTTGGAYDTTNDGGDDVFVFELSADGTTLQASTFIGGSTDDAPAAVDISPTGQIIVGGATDSNAYPTTTGAFDETNPDAVTDGFVTSFNPALTGLNWSTLISAVGIDFVTDISIDADGAVYAAMELSGSIASSPGAYDSTWESPTTDAWVGRLSADGSSLDYSTYLTGSGDDTAQAVRFEADDRIHVGWMRDTTEAYYSVLDPTATGASQLVSSTLIADIGTGSIGDIDLDSAGRVYLVGGVFTAGLATGNAHDSTHGGGEDGFLTVYDALGGQDLFTYFGEAGENRATGVAVDNADRPIVVGPVSDATNANSFISRLSTLNVDSDGDGLWDHEEDANTDLDNDPATNPGPDTDSDTTPNYLDADDDNDGTPTASENADPNADGDPRDALDSDRDGQPDYLDAPITGATNGTVGGEQKISDTVGGLTATLDSSDFFGSSVTAIGDLDGDGIVDLAVGARLDDDGGIDRGAIHVLFMNPNGTVKTEQKISDTAGGLTATLGNSDNFGSAVAGVGDLDGDGIVDLAVGAPLDDDGGFDRGAIHVLFMNPNGTVKTEQKISNTTGALTATLDDNDNFGSAVAGVGDLDGDGIVDLAVGAPLDDDGGIDRGAIHVLFMNPNGTVKTEQKISNTTGGLTATLDNSDQFGRSVTAIGDLDGDGIVDLAVGAPLDDDGGIDRGAIHVLFMNPNGTVKTEQKISDTAGGLTATLDNSDYFGSAVAGVGDLDDDGTPDLTVGAPLDDDGGTNRGAIHVLFMNPNGTVKTEQKISNTTGALTATLDDNDLFGYSVTGLGDLDSDGVTDLAVGAMWDDDGGTDRGAVYILDLTALVDSDGDGLWDHEEDANTDLDDDPATNPGPDTDGDTLPNYLDPDDDNDGVPTASENADPNGDGDPRDARDSDRDGEPDYLDLPTISTDGTVDTEDKIASGVGGFTGSLGFNDAFGSSVTSIGDIDGDGINDIAVGAIRDDDGGFDAGAVYILFLNTDGTVRTHRKITEGQSSFGATLDSSDYFGTAVAGIGDINGDGINDIAVGAIRDDDGGFDAGAVYILFLNADGTVDTEQKITEGTGGFSTLLDSSDYFGGAVAGIGDINGDGTNDIAVGAIRDDDGGSNAGAVYILFLNTDGTVDTEQKITEGTGGLSTLLDSTDHFGSAVAGIGDINGDGTNDIAVGAIEDDDGGSDAGAVYILFLNTDGTVDTEQKITEGTGGLSTLLDSTDHFGSAVAGIGDINGDGIDDIAVGAIEDDDGGSDAGAVYILFLNTDGTVRAEQKITEGTGGLSTLLDNNDSFGFSVAGLGDFNGDGAIDIAVGAPEDDDGGLDRGGLYILNLTPPPDSDSDGDGLWDRSEDANVDADDNPATNPGPDTDGDSTPNYLDADDDGDGIPTANENPDPNGDGEPRDARDTDRDGQPDYLDQPTGQTTPTVAQEQKISDLAGGLLVDLEGADDFGSAVAAIGDLDGDGTVDIAVGAPFDGDGGAGAGAVYILFMNPDGTVKNEQKISELEGGLVTVIGPGDAFGASVSGIGDIDGDGINDIVVGARADDDGQPNAGAVYILFLDADGTVKDEQKISSAAGDLTATLANLDLFGSSVSGIDDLDGDGINDIVVGARLDNDGGTNRGAAYILFLNANGTVKDEQKISDLSGGFTAALADSDAFGSAVAGLGDVDGDGLVDLAVGASGDDGGTTDEGAFYVLFLNADGTVKSERRVANGVSGLSSALSSGDRFGSSIAAIGDLDLDGVPDLVVGAPDSTGGSSGEGAIYVLTMNADGTVESEQKIAEGSGGLGTSLATFDEFGASVAGLGDLDGDRTLGLAIGATGDDDGGARAGATYVIDLSPPEPVVFDNAQSGTTTLANGSTSDVVTITAVDPTRSFLTFSVRGDGSAPSDTLIRGELTNATTVTFRRDDTVGDVVIEWSITEFASGVTVQRGTTTLSGGPENETIVGVDRLRSFPLISMSVRGSSYGDNDFVSARLTSNTNLQLVTRGATNLNIVDWQVVTYNDSAVQSGTVELGASDTSGTATIDAVDPAKSWLIYTTETDSGAADISQQLVRGQISDATTLSFDRVNAVQAMTVTWHLVQFTDTTTVQHASVNFPTSTTTVDVPIAQVDPARSIAVGGERLYGGRTANTADNNPASGWFTTSLSSSTNLRIQRNAAPASADLGWSVINWPADEVDSDGDGLWDSQEDINADDDFDPATSPGPDTDSDATPDYLDADDDGDGIPTALENADPNGDGDPRDALDADRDGQPDYLDVPANTAIPEVATLQKISDAEGGLVTALTDGDQFGRSTASIGDIDSDGVADLAVGAWYDDEDGSQAGAVYILLLNADGTVKAERKINETSGDIVGLVAGDFFGRAVAGIGDIDGDGVADIAVGAPGDNLDGVDRGAIYVLRMNSDGSVKAEQRIGDTNGGLGATLDNSDGFGTAIGGLGDLDGDGINDIAVGAPGDDDGGIGAGAVYVLFLDSSGVVTSETKINPAALPTTVDTDDDFGSAVAALGDIDADGVSDIAVGAPGDATTSANAGAFHILFLNTDGTIDGGQKLTDGVGGFDSDIDSVDLLGDAVSGVGDLDGNGTPDVLVGTRGDDDGGGGHGAVYVVSLNSAGSAIRTSKIFDGSEPLLGELDDYDFFGSGVASMGDLDGDGSPTLAVGAHTDDDSDVANGGDGRGAVYLLELVALHTVNSTDDDLDLSVSDGVCDTGGFNSDGDPECTLHAAIAQANSSPDRASIEFDIPTSDGGHTAGVWRSEPTRNIPAISTTMSIDASSQPGYASSPVIEIDGGGVADGVSATSAASDVTIRGFSMGGFTSNDIELRGSGHLIAGNYLGVMADGTSAFPISTAGASVNVNSVSGSVIGGSTAADRNVIGSGTWSIVMSNSSTGNTVSGNYIGVDATGNTALLEPVYGVALYSGSDAVIGGATSAHGNVIAATAHGVLIDDEASDGAIVRNNLVGIGADGTTAIGSGSRGVTMLDGGDNTVIDANVIGNRSGAAIWIAGASIGTQITSNLLGIDGSGNSHAIGPGIVFTNGADDSVVGGTDPADGNTITNASGAGVTVATGQHSILGNSIFGNTGVGIDIGDDGVTEPDTGDVDGVPNQPTLLGAIESAGTTTVDLVFDAPIGTYLIQYFDNPNGADPSGFGEGEQLIAAVPVTITSSGAAVLRHTVPGIGLTITATATHNSTAATSEFSNAIDSASAGGAAIGDITIRRSDLTSLGGAPSFVTGAAGDAIALDGTTDLLVGPALDVTDSALSIGASVLVDTLAGVDTVISKRASDGGVIYELSIDGATGEAVASINTAFFPIEVRGGTITAATWHQLDAVWDGATFTLYVDGIAVDSAAAVGTLHTDVATNMVVGARSDGTRRLDGALDNVQVRHDAISAQRIAAHHSNSNVGGFIIVGDEQTDAAGAWTTSSVQTRSGGFAMSAPEVDPADAPAWATATGIDEPGIVFTSWWWLSQATALDVAAGTRATDRIVEQYSGAAVDTPAGWQVRQPSGGGAESVDASTATPLSTGQWVQVEIWTDQNGDTRLLIDGTEVIGWTPQGSALASGSAGLLANELPIGAAWYVDDAQARKLVFPEPVTSLGTLDRR